MPETTGRLKWDQDGTRKKNEGIDRGVLFVMNKGTYNTGVVWDGLTEVQLSPDGAEATDLWADNMKYLTLYSAENFGYTINAFYSPVEFDQCDGEAEGAKGVTLGQQTRRSFGFSYRSGITNDTEGEDYGYIIHLIYNSKAKPSEQTDSTKSDSPNSDALSWECSTTPVAVNRTDPATGKDFKPVSHMKIDSTQVDPAKLKAFEDILYGTDEVKASGETSTAKPATASKLMSPGEVIDFFKTEG